MNNFLDITIRGQSGVISLNRPKALNALNLDMVRAIYKSLINWGNNNKVKNVILKSNDSRSFCAGGDIRFFYEKGLGNSKNNSALLEDFFTEEYSLNHLIHFYSKPYISILNGVVMGGGMGISQAGPNSRICIVTENTKMAMPEVGIGLFPDVGGSYFLSNLKNEIGTYLGLTGDVIGHEDAIYSSLADYYIPSSNLDELYELIYFSNGNTKEIVRDFSKKFKDKNDLTQSKFLLNKNIISEIFSLNSVSEIIKALEAVNSIFSNKVLKTLKKKSPLMMCVTLSQIRRAKNLSLSDCLRMERNMVRRCFENGQIIEGIRAMVIDKDHMPRWSPAKVSDVSNEMIDIFFDKCWPDYAHPLKELS